MVGGKAPMFGSLELVFSISAVLISAATSYFTVWNARYLLGATTTKVNWQAQTSSSRDADKPVEATYRIFVKPRIIFTHRGTRSVVVTKIALIRPKTAGAEEVIVERLGEETSHVFQPNNVLEISPEFPLPRLHNDFEQFRERWNLVFTVVDHKGRRSDPQIPLLDVMYRLTPDSKDPEAAPNLSIDLDYQRRPIPVVKSGWLASWM
jgi:hypothetical protein